MTKELFWEMELIPWLWGIGGEKVSAPERRVFLENGIFQEIILC